MTPYPGFTPVAGLVPAIEAVTQIVCENGTWKVGNLATAQAVSASHNPLAWLKSNYLGTGKQDALSAKGTQLMTLFNMIDGGTQTNLTANQVSTYIAAVANNYRQIKAAINAAATVGALQAIDIAVGWPANP